MFYYKGTNLVLAFIFLLSSAILLLPLRIFVLLFFLWALGLDTFNFWLFQCHATPFPLPSKLISIPEKKNISNRLQGRSAHKRKGTYRSFQKTLSNVSSLVSSSVTPPKRMPMAFAAHRVIVHPLRREGAYASDARLRRSHLIVRWVKDLPGVFDDDFCSVLTVFGAGLESTVVDGNVILWEIVVNMSIAGKFGRLVTSVTRYHRALCQLGVSLSRIPYNSHLILVNLIFLQCRLVDIPCNIIPSAQGRKEKPLRGLFPLSELILSETK